MADARLIPRSYKQSRSSIGHDVFLDGTLGGKPAVKGRGIFDSKHRLTSASDADPKSSRLESLLSALSHEGKIDSALLSALMKDGKLDAVDTAMPSLGPIGAPPAQMVGSKDPVPPGAYNRKAPMYVKPRRVSKYSKQSGLKQSQRKKQLRFKGFGLIDEFNALKNRIKR